MCFFIEAVEPGGCGMRLLITGATGQIGNAIALRLAAAHEVVGVARFADPADRSAMERAGVTPVACDLGSGDLSALPARVDHVLHFAAYQAASSDYDAAIRMNAEATGLLMHRYRAAKSILVASTFSVYDPHADPWHQYVETDPLGEARLQHAPTYSVSKIGQEAVARTMARVLKLPTVIARINVAYGDQSGLPFHHLQAITRGNKVRLRAPAPTPYSPIHHRDMAEQVWPLLDAARSPATIVNWCGDEVVTAEQWCEQMAKWSDRSFEIELDHIPGSQPGAAGDATRRNEITGPCNVNWKHGIRELVDGRNAAT